jgi:hypothetical protein
VGLRSWWWSPENVWPLGLWDRFVERRSDSQRLHHMTTNVGPRERRVRQASSSSAHTRTTSESVLPLARTNDTEINVSNTADFIAKIFELMSARHLFYSSHVRKRRPVDCLFDCMKSIWCRPTQGLNWWCKYPMLRTKANVPSNGMHFSWNGNDEKKVNC